MLSCYRKKSNCYLVQWSPQNLRPSAQCINTAAFGNEGYSVDCSYVGDGGHCCCVALSDLGPDRTAQGTARRSDMFPHHREHRTLQAIGGHTSAQEIPKDLRRFLLVNDFQQTRHFHQWLWQHTPASGQAWGHVLRETKSVSIRSHRQKKRYKFSMKLHAHFLYHVYF